MSNLIENTKAKSNILVILCIIFIILILSAIFIIKSFNFNKSTKKSDDNSNPALNKKTKGEQLIIFDEFVEQEIKKNDVKSSNNTQEVDVKSYVELSKGSPIIDRVENVGAETANNNLIKVSNDDNSISAYKSTLDPDFTISAGSIIECSLITKINTAIAGATHCIINNDIYSDNGKVLLIEAGSKVIGEYKAEQLDAGAERIFVIWNKIKTPNNVIIDINSAVAGGLGEAGLDGKVKEHFFKKFGSALLISLISSGFDAVNKKHANSTFNFESSNDKFNSIIEAILSRHQNIKPTLIKNNGETTLIIVNKDIDFKNVYDLELEE